MSREDKCFFQIGSDFGLVGGGTPSSFTSSPPSSTPLALSTIEAVRSGPSLLSTEMIFSLSGVSKQGLSFVYSHQQQHFALQGVSEQG